MALLWPWWRWKRPDFTVNEVWHLAAMTAVAVLAATTTYFANGVRQAEAQVARLQQGTPTVVETPARQGIFHDIEDLPRALAEAEEDGRYVLVFVYHPWCGGCRAFKEHVYQTQAFEDFAAARCVQLVVNAQDSDISSFMRVPVRLSRPLDPKLYPTIALIASDGEVVFLDEGLRDYLDSSPERFIALLGENMPPH